MSMFRKALLYCGLEKEEYEGIRPLIDERNFSSTNIVSIAMLFFGCVFLLSRIVTGAPILFPYYFLIICAVLFLLTRAFFLKKANHLTLLFCYLQMCVVFVFAIILSSQGSNRENPSTSIIVFLALLPLIINDRPIRMFAVVSVFVVAYLICSSYVKIPSAHQDDIFNTLTFSILGMAVYLLISNRNVHEIYLRTKAAESDRLREEKRAADLANAAKSEFLANMSHEIRTPINAVLGMNEMILREVRKGDNAENVMPAEARAIFGNIRSYADSVQSAGENLLSIINDILDFSRIEAGKMEIVNGIYRLGSLISELDNMISFRARSKGLDFSIRADEFLPAGYYGDEVHIRQVLLNLLTNAVKYTHSGSVQLVIGKSDGATPAIGEKITLVISVVDTGIGIRREDIDKLFGKFERIDLESNSTVEGTGLGLAIARKLTEQMGGSIQVDSVFGQGSTFTVRLPQIVAVAEPIGDVQQMMQNIRTEDPGTRETFRAPDAAILIVDDTELNLRVATSLLQHTQIRIDTASGGAEAVEKCQANHYDLILMDQRMPQMEGTEALRLIRRQEGGRNLETPCICLTADAVNGARDRYIAEGFTDYLTKPISSRDLEAQMIRCLPPEKVTIVRSTAPEKENSTPNGPDREQVFAALQSAGADPASGMKYCQDDFAFYLSVLEDYAGEYGKKAADLQTYYDNRDWDQYSILVHSLKSTSKMIGADGLHEEARNLEEASRNRDTDTVLRNHGKFMEDYSKMTEAILSVITLLEGKTTPNDDVMEFDPEP